ncbi:MAG TPA: glycine zipper family protein [Nitrospiraceae bacterium]|nr:glycine zipper family protein [Nitrospiraceae bacterium]
MFKIKKRASSQGKLPALYNIIEDYTEFDAPGNVTVCAMTESEDVTTHARVLSESYEVPLEVMTMLLTQGGLYLYPQDGQLVTRGLFACKIDPAGHEPKQTWVLDVVQYAEAEQLTRSYGLTLEEAAARIFYRTLAPELRSRLQEKNLGLDYSKLDRAIARHGDIKFIDFRKDWSTDFKRLCIMPDGKLVETSGPDEFASLHGITVAQARRLIEQGGTLEVDGEVLACQIVNGQPSVARFNRRQYAKAKEIAEARGVHMMDALSEVGLSDPAMMQALKRREQLLRALVLIFMLGLMACSGPKPILYPNGHYQTVGKETAEHDIAECQEMAEAAGATPEKGKGAQVAGSTVAGAGIGAASGAVGGAVVGAAGSGSAIGAAGGATAGLLRGLFSRPKPSEAYMGFVNRCLKERGYDPVGWK